jgi:hypothetical protein
MTKVFYPVGLTSVEELTEQVSCNLWQTRKHQTMKLTELVKADGNWVLR